VDLSQIYLICFGVGLVFAVISAFFADVFGGHHFEGDAHAPHGHAEGGFGSHDMPGFAALSPTTIASFITAFGGFGLILSKFNVTASPWIHVPLSIFAGFVVAAGVFLVFSRIFRATQSSSEGRVGELMGQSATVITPIAPDGVGEIAYVQNGTRYTAPARSHANVLLPAGSSVWIVRVEGAHFYVNSQ
jgi:membrane protein implicated in regulation of membrane protease activity